MKNILKRFSLVLMVIIGLLSLMSCNSYAEEKDQYVYQGENGAYATLTVDFDAGTYTYDGNDFYSSYTGYILRPETSYKVSSTIYYVKEVNNEKYYKFHDHPWNNKYYFVLSEDGQTITCGLMGMYKFHKQ